MLYNIIADAAPLAESEIKKIKTLNNLIALDGAAEFLIANDIIPFAVVGDLDSIKKDTLRNLESLGVTIKKVEDQNTTDLEKGIYFCDSLGASEIHLYNAFGERIDHSLFNLRILKAHHSSTRLLRLYNKFEYAHYIRNQKVNISGPIGSRVAIMAFPEARITSRGLLYETEDYELKFAYQESICNSLQDKEVEIKVEGEALLILSDEIVIKSNQ